MKDNDFLTIREFAELTAIPAPTAWWYARRGTLPTSERFGVRIVARSDVEPFMRDLAAHKRFSRGKAA